MKKYLLLFIIAVLMLAACSSKSKDGSADNQTYTVSDSVDFDFESAEVLEESDNFETSFNNGQYYTVIKNDDGKEIFTHGPSSVEPVITDVNDSIIKLSLNSSDNVKHGTYIFYNLNDKSKSRAFIGVSDETDTKVAVIGDSSVEIYEIFGNGDSLVEFTEFSEELSPTIDAIISAEFSEDGTEVTVTYYAGDNYEEKTDTFSVQ